MGRMSVLQTSPNNADTTAAVVSKTCNSSPASCPVRLLLVSKLFKEARTRGFMPENSKRSLVATSGPIPGSKHQVATVPGSYLLKPSPSFSVSQTFACCLLLCGVVPSCERRWYAFLIRNVFRFRCLTSLSTKQVSATNGREMTSRKIEKIQYIINCNSDFCFFYCLCFFIQAANTSRPAFMANALPGQLRLGMEFGSYPRVAKLTVSSNKL